MQAIHAPLIRPSGITHALHIPRFSSATCASIVLAGGQRVRVYELAGKRLRKVYDQVWGGDVTGLACVRTVGSVADGRERVVVGFGGKVRFLFLLMTCSGSGNRGHQECVDACEDRKPGVSGHVCERDSIFIMESHRTSRHKSRKCPSGIIDTHMRSLSGVPQDPHRAA